MQIRLSRFFLDEKDLFVFALGVFILASFIFKIPISPFRLDSLVIVFLFLLVTRSLVSNLRFMSYLMVALLGLVFSTFLSPYGLLIFFVIAILLYTKTNLL